MKKKFLVFASVALTAALCVGCGEKKPDGLPNLAPVTVTITQGGAPLADADVSFFPQNPENKKWASGGRTGADGKIIVMTMGKYKGMVPDTYKATVMKTQIDNPPMKEDDPPAEIYQLVDSKYSSEATTDLSITVEGTGSQEFTLDVGEEVKVKQ